MTKKDIILQHYDEWLRGDITTIEVTKIAKTRKRYTLEVFAQVRRFAEINSECYDEPLKPPEDEFQSITEPNWKIEDEINSITFEIEGLGAISTDNKPRVNLLPNGKVELIYQSKLNYD